MVLEIYSNKEVEKITDNFYIIYKLFEVLDAKQQGNNWVKRFKRCYRYCEKMDIEILLDNKVKMFFYDVPCKSYGSLDVYKILEKIK